MTAIIFHVLWMCYISSTVGEFMTYQMEDLCGKTVGETSTAGKFSFDFSKLTSTTGFNCSVTVQPELTSRRDGSTSKVMVYFTEFELESFCTETNLTLYDANAPVSGTQKEMCGRNDTLLKSFFSTYSDHFRVVFRWNKYGERYRNAKFTLNYISYYDGPCVDDGQSRKCGLSERCVPTEFYCSLGEDLHECGYTDETECQEIVMNWLDNLLDQLKNVAIVMAIVIAAYFVVRVLRALRDQGLFKNCQSIDKMIAFTSRRSRLNETGTTAAATDASRNSLTLDNVSRRNSSASSNSSEENGNPSIERSNLSSENDIRLNFDSTGPDQNFLSPPEPTSPLPSGAPPSYDEVMGSSYSRSNDNINQSSNA
ncbi:hypothetical protein MAR_000766 [Mya arenaria]|uniref:CUB domain-containing protein n=1 Tax=Mya arenaria TaxID=6604 RepID=A0ABY7F9R7_MYAAR|nr:uncharacterized protein LOC128209518 [Mya arenaria]WAR18928.1 hypothetical protein MAR_000766 [Mya arenaria]